MRSIEQRRLDAITILQQKHFRLLDECDNEFRRLPLYVQHSANLSFKALMEYSKKEPSFLNFLFHFSMDIRILITKKYLADKIKTQIEYLKNGGDPSSILLEILSE